MKTLINEMFIFKIVTILQYKQFLWTNNFFILNLLKFCFNL
jgi:hypothetical protein